MIFPSIKMANKLAKSYKSQGPFVRIEYDQAKQTIARFISAVTENPDKGWAFVSRVYSAGLNLEELHDIFKSDIRHITGAKYVTHSKKATIHSIYIQDKILHLHMVNQPDRNSKWKIFGVEFTQCK